MSRAGVADPTIAKEDVSSLADIQRETNWDLFGYEPAPLDRRDRWREPSSTRLARTDRYIRPYQVGRGGYARPRKWLGSRSARALR